MSVFVIRPTLLQKHVTDLSQDSTVVAKSAVSKVKVGKKVLRKQLRLLIIIMPP